MSPNDDLIDKPFVLNLINKGNFAFLLDGFDEIATEDRDFSVVNLLNFISRSPKNQYILSSRDEEALASFTDFAFFGIRPLNKKEAFLLLRKYDNHGELSTQLISKVDEIYDDLKDFMTNPLLVSLLYIAYEHRNTVPLKKHIFYRQVYDALYQNHDLTKVGGYVRKKYCEKLDIEDFHRILRHIGFSCLKANKIEFNKDEIIQIIKSSKTYNNDLQFKESDFLNDIIKSVPIFILTEFITDGPTNLYKNILQHNLYLLTLEKTRKKF